MVAFCEKHEIPYDQCGKVIVAASESERVLLEELYQKGQKNGLQVSKISREKLLELEPHVQGLEAIHVPMAGIVNYQVHVCNAPSPAATASIEIGKEVVKMVASYKVTM